jgi:NAD(P)-dependent dehydrogenase (short-subunit alcohol dehydrogenase family)
MPEQRNSSGGDMGKVAVVTGGASGIGRALAAALVARGDTVVLADVDEAADAVARDLSHDGPGTAVAMRLDVRDADAVRSVLTATHGEHGRLDLLFNNAGVGIGGEFDDLTLEHWNRAIDVNVRGVVHGIHAAVPLMLAQGYGHIVNTASIAGLLPSPFLAPYSMSKHAVVGLTLSLRAELGERGVRLSALCPGVIETPILDKGNPGDLPPLSRELPVRDYLQRFNKPYPAAALAAATLRGVDRNRALIIAPRSAYVQWVVQRISPKLIARVEHRHVTWARTTMAAGAPTP